MVETGATRRVFREKVVFLPLLSWERFTHEKIKCNDLLAIWREVAFEPKPIR